MAKIVYWAQIENFNYLVSSEGDVANSTRNRKYSKHNLRGKAEVVTIYIGTKGYVKRVDELVATAFIREKMDGEIIEHIDGDYSNNNRRNLRWAKIEKYLEFVHGNKWKLIEDELVIGSYYICTDGRVWSLYSEDFMSTRVHVGYPSVSFGYPNKQFCHIHVLIAKAFVRNPKPALFDIVNHKDEDPNNFAIENLEWCTQQYNTIYSINRSGRKVPIKQKKVTADKGGVELFEGYLIYKDGRVYSKKAGFYLSQTPNGSGYPRVEIFGVKRLVHYLVAEAFLPPHPDTDDIYEIDHIDRKKTNNSVKNLEWVTKSEQMKRCAEANKETFSKGQKPVVQMTMSGKVIKIFSGVKEAGRQTKTNSGSITKACRGVRPSAGGYKWKYYIKEI